MTYSYSGDRFRAHCRHCDWTHVATTSAAVYDAGTNHDDEGCGG